MRRYMILTPTAITIAPIEMQSVLRVSAELYFASVCKIFRSFATTASIQKLLNKISKRNRLKKFEKIEFACLNPSFVQVRVYCIDPEVSGAPCLGCSSLAVLHSWFAICQHHKHCMGRCEQLLQSHKYCLRCRKCCA